MHKAPRCLQFINTPQYVIRQGKTHNLAHGFSKCEVVLMKAIIGLCWGGGSIGQCIIHISCITKNTWFFSLVLFTITIFNISDNDPEETMALKKFWGS